MQLFPTEAQGVPNPDLGAASKGVGATGLNSRSCVCGRARTLRWGTVRA